MNTQSTRRQFLGRTAALVSAPLFVPASALGRGGGKSAASERIAVGVIGTGGRGQSLIRMFLREKDADIVAVCDVDARHLDAGQKAAQKGGKKVATYRDFRDLIGHKGLNAVIVATPDHWHALPSIAACKAGLDVYCEKPLTNSIGEGRALCKAAAEHKRVVQCGSHERSGTNARFACEIVRNGKIGTLKTVRINLPCSDPHHRTARTVKSSSVKASTPPKELDYDLWLGHTPRVPYIPERVHRNWRWVLAYGGGEMTDRGAHVIDLAQLGMGTDDTGPVEIEATGKREKDCLYDCFWDYTFTNTYASGVKMVGSVTGPRGVKFEGTDGWVFIHVHGAKLEASSPDLLKLNADAFKVKLGRATGHARNFLDAVRTRAQPFASAEIGHRTASICHLNNIAMTLGKKLKWDPVKEQFDDAEANKMLTPVMRAPWKL
jgi:predicted dehydrogenase